MMGLMILIFFAVYLLVSLVVTKKTVSWAKANNKKPWLWGGLAAFMMYNLVFWDLIPTLAMHKYYCDTQAGFWVYKTPEQWKKNHYKDYKKIMNGLDRSSIEGYKAYGEFEKKYLFIDDSYTGRKISHALETRYIRFYDIDNLGKKTLMVEIKNFWRGKSGSVFGLGGTLDELRQAIVLGWGSRECSFNGSKLSDKETDVFNSLANWEKTE